MSTILDQLVPGQEVKVSCCQPGCETTETLVKLGEEIKINPNFNGKKSFGRFPTKGITAIRVFDLSKEKGGSGFSNTCPSCAAASVVAVAICNGHGDVPVVFGYGRRPED